LSIRKKDDIPQKKNYALEKATRRNGNRKEGSAAVLKKKKGQQKQSCQQTHGDLATKDIKLKKRRAGHPSN